MKTFFECRAHGGVARGFGLVELMVGLLIFSIASIGLRSSQLLAGRANSESIQATQAILLAREMLARIENNPLQLALYIAESDGWDGSPPVVSASACVLSACSTAELARYDVAQWQRWLLGAAGSDTADTVAMLPGVTACLERRDTTVTVFISWLGGTGEFERPDSGCLERSEALFAGSSGAEPVSARRVHISLASSIPG